jgi:hypothetical protein
VGEINTATGLVKLWMEINRHPYRQPKIKKKKTISLPQRI